MKIANLWGCLVKAVAGAVLIAMNASVLAADASHGDSLYHSVCTNCHNANVNLSSGGGTYPAPALNNGGDASNLQFLINHNSMPSRPYTTSLETSSDSTINPDVADIAAYIANPNYSTADIAAPTTWNFNAQPLGTHPTHPFSVTNNGPGTLHVTGYVVSDGATNYAVDVSNCAAVAAGSPACSVVVTFQPTVAGTYNGRTVTLTTDSGSPVSTLTLNGRAYDPAPLLTTAGFTGSNTLALTAATDGSVTMCPTFTNNNDPLGNTLSFTVSSAASGSTDYTGYYAIGNIAECLVPVTSPPQCVTAAATLTGTVSAPLAAGGGACTLPIKFDPSPFGLAQATGAKPATLRITSNAPSAGTLTTYTLNGVVTQGPEPTIGDSTGTAALSGSNVLPGVFANQVIHTSSSLWSELTISNSSTNADGLVITNVLNSNPTEFALTQTCVGGPALAMANNGSCVIGLTFTPSQIGQRCTTVTVQAQFASNTPLDVIVCGTGKPVPVPALGVTPGSIAFGSRSIGATYLAQPLTISNAAGATADLLVGAVAISGSGFSFVPDASACQSKTIAAGASCTLQVQFTPDPATPSGTPFAANVTIASNDPNTPNLSVPLSATALAHAVPALQWVGAPASLSFPSPVTAGQSAASPLTVLLTNPNGPGGADVQAVRLVGTDASSFSVSACPALLFQGDVCTISIGFLPGSGGTKTAQLQVVTTSSTAPPLLAVQGTGVGSGSATLMLSATTLDFGDVRLGANSTPQELRLTANGDGALLVTAIAVDGPFSVSSKSCPALPFTLASGSDCSLSVSFVPNSSSSMSGKLSVTSGSGATTTDVTLDGTGQSAANVSGGGCSIASGERLTDPTLWALVLLALAVLGHRHRERRSNGANPRKQR